MSQKILENTPKGVFQVFDHFFVILEKKALVSGVGIIKTKC